MRSAHRSVHAHLCNTEAVSREDLVQEAAYLTKSLYRKCMRSIRHIRWGNYFDDKEFQRREEEFQNPTAGGVMSMGTSAKQENSVLEPNTRSCMYVVSFCEVTPSRNSSSVKTVLKLIKLMQG